MARYIDIDREIRLMEDVIQDKDSNDFTKYVFKAFIEKLKKVPTADVVEVKRGKWNDNIIGFCNVCSECGVIVERTAIKNNSGKLNYCPNCGAKMNGGKEE